MCSSSVSSAEPPPEPSQWTQSRTAPGSWSRTTEAKQIRPEERRREESNLYPTAIFVQFYESKNTSNNSVKAHLCSKLDTDRDGVDCPYSKFISSIFWHVV